MPTLRGLPRPQCREFLRFYLHHYMTHHILTCLLDETYLQPVIFTESGPLTCRYKTQGVPPSAPGPKDTWRCASVRHGNFVDGCGLHIQRMCVVAIDPFMR